MVEEGEDWKSVEMPEGAAELGEEKQETKAASQEEVPKLKTAE